MRHCSTTSLPCVSYSLLADIFVCSSLFMFVHVCSFGTGWTHTDLQRHLPHMLIPRNRMKSARTASAGIECFKVQSVGNISNIGSIDRFDKPLGAQMIQHDPTCSKMIQKVFALPDSPKVTWSKQHNLCPGSQTWRTNRPNWQLVSGKKDLRRASWQIHASHHLMFFLSLHCRDSCSGWL